MRASDDAIRPYASLVADNVDERSAAAAIESLSEPTPAGVALTMLELAGSMVPVIGGPLSVALEEIKRARDGRLAAVLHQLDREIRTLGDRLDADYVRSPGFARKLEATLDEALRARQAEKRLLYARAIAGLASQDRPDEGEWDLLVDALDRMRPGHLALLADLVRLDRDDPEWASSVPVWEAIRAAAPSTLPDDAAHRCWEDLAQLGIVEGPTLVTDAAPVTTPNGVGRQSHLTTFGERFVDFLALSPD